MFYETLWKKNWFMNCTEYYFVLDSLVHSAVDLIMSYWGSIGISNLESKKLNFRLLQLFVLMRSVE